MSKTNGRIEAKRIDDVKTLLKISVARYLDYSKYWNALAEVDESFDESIGYFDTETWINLTAAPKNVNKLILNAASSLNKSMDSFRTLMESAESECKELLTQILRMEKDIKIEIFGDVFDYDASIIEKIFEEIHELDYQYNMEDAYDMFVLFVSGKFNEKKKAAKMLS